MKMGQSDTRPRSRSDIDPTIPTSMEKKYDKRQSCSLKAKSLQQNSLLATKLLLTGEKSLQQNSFLTELFNKESKRRKSGLRVVVRWSEKLVPLSLLDIGLSNYVLQGNASVGIEPLNVDESDYQDKMAKEQRGSYESSRITEQVRYASTTTVKLPFQVRIHEICSSPSGDDHRK